MEEAETVLDALEDDDGYTLDGDEEMLDAEAPGGHAAGDGFRSGLVEEPKGAGGEGEDGEIARGDCGGEGDRRKAAAKWRKKKKKKNKNKNRNNRAGSSDYRITDINRFVIDACRQLKEKKPYLIWNAIGCLGVSAISDLVKEVHVIQACGGQTTADGSRPRTGGGILWNILKTREPKAYKEIMTKGKEFEKQFQPKNGQRVTKENEEPMSPKNDGVAEKAGQISDGQQNGGMRDPEPSSAGERVSVLNRIRAPVSYDDLFEEGEIV